MPGDATHMRSLEQSDSQRQKAGWWLPGAGDGGRAGVFSGDRGSASRGTEGSGEGRW